MFPEVAHDRSRSITGKKEVFSREIARLLPFREHLAREFSSTRRDVEEGRGRRSSKAPKLEVSGIDREGNEGTVSSDVR